MSSSNAGSFPAGVKPFAERKQPKTICMFDVDGTLSVARQSWKPETQAAIKELRKHTAVAVVGGSDLPKILEQLDIKGENSELSASPRSQGHRLTNFSLRQL